MTNTYSNRRMLIMVFLIAVALMVISPLLAKAATTTKKVKSLAVEYVSADSAVTVSWKHSSKNAQYQVKVLSGGEKVASKTTKKKEVSFDSSLFTDGEEYTVQVRVKPTKAMGGSGWKKTTYTHSTSGTSEAQACPTDGISHDVYVTSSTNPASFPDSSTAAITKASVPDAVLLTQTTNAGNAGDILAYFVRTGVCMVRSTDNGATWSDPVAIQLTGDETVGGPVDPSLVQLDNGQLRLYYFGSETTTGDPAQVAGNHVIYSALSDDGVNFTVESGERFSLASITDPEVIRLGSSWIMYVSNGSSTIITTSTDGLTFTQNSTWNGGGIPGAYVDSSNLVHIYGCSGGVNTATSTDGLTFGSTTTSVIPATSGMTTCDPSPVLLSSGAVLMVYKKQSNSNTGGGSK